MASSSGANNNNMSTLLRQLKERRQARWFLRPVDPVLDGVPHYFSVIQNPMDLRTVSERLSRGEYNENRELFADDIRLIFSNAISFNVMADDPIRRDAMELSKWFEQKWTGKREATKETKVLQALIRDKKASKYVEALSKISSLGDSFARDVRRVLSTGDSNSSEYLNDIFDSLWEEPKLTREIQRVLKGLGDKDVYGTFSVPVSLVAVPDYLSVVEKPMDFSTASKIEYDSFSAFEKDVRLIFQNARKYNPPKHPVRLAADELEAYYDDVLASDYAKYDAILELAYQAEESLYFRQKVDPDALGIPEYRTMIAKPMCLDSMWELHLKKGYSSREAMVADARLIVDNAQTFNSDPEHPIHREATRFDEKFTKIVEEVFSKTKEKKVPSLDQKMLKSIMNALTRKKDLAWYFLQPVDPVALGIPDYFDVIKKPMDLGTIDKKLGEYSSVQDFADDVRLVFRNAMIYNPNPKLAVHDAAKQLLHLFNVRLAKSNLSQHVLEDDFKVEEEEEEYVPSSRKKQQAAPAPPPKKKLKTLVFQKVSQPQQPSPPQSSRPSQQQAKATTSSLVFQKVSQKQDAEGESEAAAQEVEEVVADLSFVPTVLAETFAKPAEVEDVSTMLDGVVTPPVIEESEDRMWSLARAEYRLRKEREEKRMRRRKEEAVESRRREKERRRQQIEEIERIREEKRQLEEQQLQEQEQQAKDEENRRRLERERARKERAKMGKSLDLDHKRTLVSSYIDKLEEDDDF